MSENLFGLTVAADKGLDDLQCQRLLSENRRYQEVMLQYRCALKALESRLEILNEEFSLQHDRNPIESMKSRLKSPSSIMNKMQKRGLPLDFQTMQANIMDVAGVRVICSFEEDVFFLAKCLKNQSDIEIITEKDYISHPKPNGYRIWLRTRTMNLTASAIRSALRSSHPALRPFTRADGRRRSFGSESCGWRMPSMPRRRRSSRALCRAVERRWFGSSLR